jgi:hypothetical protein
MDFVEKLVWLREDIWQAPPAVMTYASVVSRESVRIALTIAALNDLEVKASDVMNAHLMVPCEERVWTILGAEFGGDSGKKAIIVRALYGLKVNKYSHERLGIHTSVTCVFQAGTGYLFSD